MPFVKWRKFMVGQGKSRAGFCGSLAPDLVAGSSLAAAETLLNSIPLLAPHLYKNGYGLRLRAWGTFAANGNNKQVKVYVNSTAIFDSGTLTDNNKEWILEVSLFRTGVKTQAIWGRLTTDTPVTVQSVAAGTLDESLDWTISVKGTAGTADADILSNGLNVEVLSQ